jgi:hypothetical protein
VIDYVTIFARIARMTANNRQLMREFILRSGTQQWYGIPMEVPYDYDWHLISEILTVNPWTKNAWLKSELNALQAGITLNRVKLPQDQYPNFTGCTQLWLEVTHHTP